MSDGEPGRIQIRRCLYRKSDSAIMVMKSAEDGRRYDAAHVLDGAMDRSVLVERPMSPPELVKAAVEGRLSRGIGVTRLRDACACRKPKSGRIGDAARQAGRATRCARFAEQGERPAHPGPMTGEFSLYCNSGHTLAGSDADASRPARRCGPRTRDGSFRSTARQTNSATASPLQWVCRGCPWLVIGV